MKKHYNILFSIPVHEKPEVVLDMVINIQHFNPNSCIILHISRDFTFDSEYLSEADFFKFLESMSSVIINPNRLRSGFEDIIQCHISNFRFAYKHIDFDYIMFAASNELYFDYGLWDDIKNYDCGPKARMITESDEWTQARRVWKDKAFVEALGKMQISKMFGGQFEGSFMRRKMMINLCDIVESFYDYKSMKMSYAREEIYFHTLISAIYPNASVRDGNTTYMNWEKNLRVSVSDVMNLINYKAGKYSIKRVPRLINAEVRAFVRKYIGCYQSELDRWFANDGKIDDDSEDYSLKKRLESKNKLYQSWLTANINGWSFCDYLLTNNIEVVSIYGYGDIGRLISYEIKKNNAIEIEYIIDRNASLFNEYNIVEPYPRLTKTKMIIVTIQSDDELMIQLKNRYAIPCIKINDLFNGINRDNHN